MRRRTARLMRIRISDHAKAAALARFLQDDAGAVVERLTPHELEATLMGSYRPSAMRAELERLVAEWTADRRADGERLTAHVVPAAGEARPRLRSVP